VERASSRLQPRARGRKIRLAGIHPGGVPMKSHMDGEVKWVWLITSLIIVYVVTLYANSGGA
jgi:hypothetical protein